jgi:hypothetical protein
VAKSTAQNRSSKPVKPIDLSVFCPIYWFSSNFSSIQILYRFLLVFDQIDKTDMVRFLWLPIPARQHMLGGRTNPGYMASAAFVFRGDCGWWFGDRSDRVSWRDLWHRRPGSFSAWWAWTAPNRSRNSERGIEARTRGNRFCTISLASTERWLVPTTASTAETAMLKVQVHVRNKKLYIN